MDLKKLGQHLRQLRQEKQLSLLDFEKKGLMTRHYLSEVENGKKNISWETLLKIAKGLGIGIEELFNEINTPNRKEEDDVLKIRRNNNVIPNIETKQEFILRNILTLHIPSGRFDLDATFSKGVFYKSGLIPEPKLKFDLIPQVKGVQKGDCQNLHMIKDNSIKSCVLDLPFIISYGGSLENPTNGKSNIIAHRFNSFRTPRQVCSTYRGALKEAYRILDKNGICVFKCMDTVSSGNQWFFSYYVHTIAEELGFYVKDKFILLAKNRLVGKHSKQAHSRKFESYFYVFEKRKNKKLKYLD